MIRTRHFHPYYYFIWGPCTLSRNRLPEGSSGGAFGVSRVLPIHDEAHVTNLSRIQACVYNLRIDYNPDPILNSTFIPKFKKNPSDTAIGSWRTFVTRCYQTRRNISKFRMAAVAAAPHLRSSPDSSTHNHHPPSFHPIRCESYLIYPLDSSPPVFRTLYPASYLLTSTPEIAAATNHERSQPKLSLSSGTHHEIPL